MKTLRVTLTGPNGTEVNVSRDISTMSEVEFKELCGHIYQTEMALALIQSNTDGRGLVLVGLLKKPVDTMDKINYIKAFRTALGVGLREAKEIVDTAIGRNGVVVGYGHVADHIIKECLSHGVVAEMLTQEEVEVAIVHYS